MVKVIWVVDGSFDADYGVALTVGERGAQWNVTGESSLRSLTVEARRRDQWGTNYTLDGQPLEPEGREFTGQILVKGRNLRRRKHRKRGLGRGSGRK